ncbi:HlyD family efflux transporter periplasmic adaptor subunit [Ramlibacter sp.]|uniref:HlyD family efflux transporter periplasmic adaptor subunit n=1 Tax=Ramlibacter sp. TaxID=1917967 RepID=UPI003D13B9AE
MAFTMGLNPAQMALPGLREDLHVQRVGIFRDGSPRFRIHDPLRNRYFELGTFDVEMLAQWQAGATPADIAARAGEQLGVDVDVEEVLALREFLLRHQLVAAGHSGDYAVLLELWRRGHQHWLVWLLHHYLFFRLPLVRPDAWLERMLPWARLLVSTPVKVALVVLAILTPFAVAREWTEFTQSFAGLFTIDGLIASAVAASFAKVLHELGHAFVARHHGVRVPVMGLAFLVLWPMLYTDTSDSWKLEDHRARFRIAAAGVATELSIALVCLFLWTLAPPGALRAALFFLATTSLILTISINASPFMRFDGYFLLSDALDFPNLHERSGALAKWWMRKQLWGIDVPAPEHFGAGMRRFLIGFAYVTWAYRAIVFLGIAALVYFAFFKALGILLMAVELVWFLARPVWSEARAVWKDRARARPRWGRLIAILALLGGTATLLAWSGESRAPALWLAGEETRIYAATPAQVAAVHVEDGQVVKAGQLLLELQAPDLYFRGQAAAVRIERNRAELARIPASDRNRERALVLQEELEQAVSEQRAVADELERLTIRSAHAGRLVDVPTDIAPGRWINPRRLLGRLVDIEQGQVRAWVSETQVRRLAVGTEVTFVPNLPERPRVEGKVVRIDTTGTRVLPHQLLDAHHGGDLIATQSARGEWQLKETLYQVDVQIPGRAPGAVLAGRLVVPTGPLDSLAAATRRGLQVLVRESGF